MTIVNIVDCVPRVLYITYEESDNTNTHEHAKYHDDGRFTYMYRFVIIKLICVRKVFEGPRGRQYGQPIDTQAT